MINVEDIEKSLEEHVSGTTGREKKYAGKLFTIYPNERIEKKSTLKGLGRNNKCICGSGKKFKKCCWSKLSFENMYELKEGKKIS